MTIDVDDMQGRIYSKFGMMVVYFGLLKYKVNITD